MHAYSMINEDEKKSDDYIIDVPEVNQSHAVIIGQQDFILSRCLTDLESIELLLKSKIRQRPLCNALNESTAGFVGITLLGGSFLAFILSLALRDKKGQDVMLSVGGILAVIAIGLLVKFYKNRYSIPANFFDPIHEFYSRLSFEEILTIQNKLMANYNLNILGINETSDGLDIKSAIEMIHNLKTDCNRAIDFNKKLKIGLFENLTKELPNVTIDIIYDYSMQTTSLSR